MFWKRVNDSEIRKLQKFADYFAEFQKQKFSKEIVCSLPDN